MQGEDQQASPNNFQRPSAEGVASGNQDLLQAVLRVSRQWEARLAVDDSSRLTSQRLIALAEQLLGCGNAPPLAMTEIRALLCTRCRRLDAAQGKCSGESLDRCLLLNGSTPMTCL
jgi:hypothetical protein